MAKQVVYFSDFRGGLNIDTAPDELADLELEQADNIVLSERGGFVKRRGTNHLNETSYNAEVTDLFTWSKGETELLLAIINANLCIVNEDGTTDIIVEVNSDKVSHFAFQDKLYIVDGTRYMVYDGVSCIDVVAENEVDNDITPIAKCKLLFRHQNSFRIFAAGNPTDPSALYYSEPNRPGYFKSTSKVYPTTGDGPVTGLVAFADALIVFYTDTIWAWRGQDPYTDAIWFKLPTGCGTVAPDTICLTPNSLMFLSKGGIYVMSPGILNYDGAFALGDELLANVTANRVTKIIKGIKNPERASAIFDPTEELYYLAYSDDSLSSANNKVLVFDWGVKSFTRFTGWNVYNFCKLLNGNLLFGSSEYINKLSDSLDDCGVPIECTVKTKNFGFKEPLNIKKIFKAFLTTQQEGELSTIDIKFSSGYENIEYKGVPLNEGFRWGDPWGSIWGFSKLITKEMKCKFKGHRIQVELYNNSPNESMRVYGIGFIFKTRRPKGVKITNG